MSMGLVFWIIMLLWLVADIYWNWPMAGGQWQPAGLRALMFILFLLLGWAVFGAPIK